MAQKPFYGSRKASDIAKFQNAISDLTDLYGEAHAKKKLAAEIGVSPSTLRRWETGKSRPKDLSVFNKVVNKHSALKTTIKNHSKRETFIDKKAPKKYKKKDVPRETIVIVEDANKWFNKYFEKRYENIVKWEYLRNLINEKGLNYVKYLSDSPREGMLLSSPNENILEGRFLHLLGVSMAYPYEDRNRQVFIRRVPRTASIINENPEANSSNAIKVMAGNNDRARKLFYSGDNNTNRIESFIGYYFD